MAQVPLQKNPIVKQCTGCENIEGEVCRIWASPAAKWRLGACPSATHIKIETKRPEEKSASGSKSRKRSRLRLFTAPAPARAL